MVLMLRLFVVPTFESGCLLLFLRKKAALRRLWGSVVLGLADFKISGAGMLLPVLLCGRRLAPLPCDGGCRAVHCGVLLVPARGLRERNRGDGGGDGMRLMRKDLLPPIRA